MKSNNEESTCDLSIALNEDKIYEDSLWDGLKGLIVNKKTQHFQMMRY